MNYLILILVLIPLYVYMPLWYKYLQSVYTKFLCCRQRRTSRDSEAGLVDEDALRTIESWFTCISGLSDVVDPFIVSELGELIS